MISKTMSLKEKIIAVLKNLFKHDEQKSENLDAVLEQFYNINEIESDNYTDSQEEAYRESKNFDDKIAKSVLKRKVEKWVEKIEKDDRKYFYRLFENFTYITKKTLDHEMDLLSKYLFQYVSKEGIEKSETIFVLVESRNGVKSGAEDIAASLWDVNQGMGLRKEQIISQFQKVNEDVIANAKAIVFIDDIVATGFTLKGTIEKFRERWGETIDSTVKYYFTGIKLTKNAIKFVKKKITNIEAIYNNQRQLLKSAFKGEIIFRASEVREIEEIVKGYEDKIASYGKGKGNHDYSMGFRQCKLLVAFRHGTPNNTLCNFWKETDSNRPVFEREVQQRPRVNDLKATKTQMENNAYNYKSID